MKVEKVSVVDKELENLEKRVEALTEDLIYTRKKIKQERRRSKLRKLKDQEYFLQNEIAYYSRQARQISENCFNWSGGQ